MNASALGRSAPWLWLLPALLALTAAHRHDQRPEPRASQEIASSPDDIYWTSRFAEPGFTSAWSNVMEVYSGELYVAGGFASFNGLTANRTLRWNGIQWSPVSGGVTGENVAYALIEAMTVFDGTLVVAGFFDHAGGIPALNVAGWNGTNWVSYGPGVSAAVTAVGVSNGILYLATNGGVFQWTGAAWAAVGTGLSGDVYAITSYDGDLVIAGSFALNAAPVHVARWNGSAWISLGTSNWSVEDALVYDGSLVVGGWFDSIDGIPALGVARWNGMNWSAMGAGVGDPYVDDLCLHQGNLLAAGGIWQQFGAPADGLLRWDGSAWVPVDAAGIQWPRNAVSFNNELYVTGDFVKVSGVNAVWDIARWDGGEWHALGAQDNLGLDEPVNSMTLWQDKLVVGGSFRAAGDKSASKIALFDGTEWTALGLGLNTAARALTTSAGRLIAGGAFTAAGGTPVLSIAAWDGSEWESLGPGLNGAVNALVEYDGDLVAAGEFTSSGGTPVSNVALWDGSSWHSLGGGTNGSVNEFALYGIDLIAGGRFTQAGGAPANRVARWNGTSWQPLGDGITCPAGKTSITWVHSLTATAGKLYVGGDFACAGGSPAYHVAAWDGSTWSALGSGLGLYPNFPGSYIATAISAWNGSLFVGGFLEQAGEKPAAMMAEWRDPVLVGVPDEPVSGRGRFKVTASPNPFRAGTKIRYHVRSAGRVQVTIQDVSGRLVARLHGAAATEGLHSVLWDGRTSSGQSASPGVYFARVRTSEGMESARLVKVD